MSDYLMRSGKHAGEKIKDIDTSYLNWRISSFTSIDMEEVIQIKIELNNRETRELNKEREILKDKLRDHLREKEKEICLKNITHKYECLFCVLGVNEKTKINLEGCYLELCDKHYKEFYTTKDV